MQLRTVETHHVPMRYFESGEGPPLVFLHGAGGITGDDALLAQLAETFHVYAPLVPGYGDSDECHAIRDMLDFTLHTWDVIEALGLRDPILVGHSMGGMIAAEMAAICPNQVSRLGLIAPVGLWLDDHPVADIFSKMPYEMPALLYHDEKAGAQALTTGLALDDPKFLQAYLVTNARQLGMAGRLLFPIPERGLSERLYRVKAKTLLVWGDSDKVVSPVYAHEFKRLIPGASLVSIPEAGHMVPLEKPRETAAALRRLA